MEDAWGGGVLVVTPWLRGEAGHAWGLSHANQRNVLILPWVQRAVDSGYSPDTLLFSVPEVTYITLRWTFRRPLAAPHPQQGCMGRLAAHTGAWTWKPLRGKPLSPFPDPTGAADWTQAQVFTRPRGAWMWGSLWELCCRH